MTFAQRRNPLTTHFSELIPVVKGRMTFCSGGLVGQFRMNSDPTFGLLSDLITCPIHATVYGSCNQSYGMWWGKHALLTPPPNSRPAPLRDISQMVRSCSSTLLSPCVSWQTGPRVEHFHSANTSWGISSCQLCGTSLWMLSILCAAGFRDWWEVS